MYLIYQLIDNLIKSYIYIVFMILIDNILNINVKLHSFIEWYNFHTSL